MELTADPKITKVCHITSVHIPFDTRIFYKECAALVEAGYEVHLVAGRTEKEEVLNGIHIHGVPVRTGKLRRMLFTTRDVYRRSLSLKPDIFHFHDPEMIPAGFLLKLGGNKVICDVHEDYPDCMVVKEFIPRSLTKPVAHIIGFVETLTAGIFDAVITVTPKIRDRFKKLNRRTVEIRNFPLPEEFTEGLSQVPWSSRSDSVAYVGLLSPDRGVKEMIHAVGIVNRTRPARLLLGGKFPAPEQEMQARNLPEFAHVDFRGFLSRDKVAEVFRKVKAGIVVTHPLSNHKFAYMTKLFEYMAAGIPVIAADFPLWRTIVENAGSGLLVEPLDPDALAQAIIWIFDHPREAEEMGKRGRKAVEEQYNWNIEKNRLLELYSEIAAE
jgi:glycosyltransferase involved in cell wall biosynthesis